MRISIVLLLALSVVSCGQPIYNGKEPYSGTRYTLEMNPRHTIDFFIENMAEQLVESNNYLTPRTPVAITSFVDVQHLEETNWLGNTVTEGFIYQMQKRGYTVVDYKTTGTIKVTEDGDFSLSRDWRQLASQQEVDFVLTGTMLRQSGGVLINARIIGLRSRVVVASAQGFLPSDRIGRDIDTLNKVRMANGVIIRDDDQTIPRETVVLKP
ncbi:FlgO family outer membrane protein [Parasalinivibrio latis]|uniref:FlgO family outer membrane protein n=1 Tax=Parasalinivibrio latis TaxID=2952610 RepID=UPI0030DEFF91